MKKSYLIAVAMFILLSGCNKEFFSPLSKRIVGEWSFEEVKYYKPFSFRAIHETDNFRNYRIYFKENHQIEYYNGWGDLVYTGTWKLEREHEYHSESTTEIDILNIYLKSNHTNYSDTTYALRNVTVFRNRLSGSNNYNKKTYSIKLLQN
jgi:hypothetical protein